jgi:glycosyltransferase involved in cell wall biosynthesis
VLQPRGLDELPAALRSKAHVIYQSAPRLSPARPRMPLDVAMIGHLRAEKDPQTFMDAARLVRTPGVRLLHIGAALDPELGLRAQETEHATPNYRWLDALPHMATRRRLRHCHAMVIASRMEGGANVIIEAVTSGVPVLASNVAGNVGMLGEDYAGLFAPGDAHALAALIGRSVADARFVERLRRQCAARAALFAPAAERARLLDLVDNLLFPSTHAHKSPV